MKILFVIRHKFEALPIISGFKLSKNGEFYFSKNKKIILTILNKNGIDIVKPLETIISYIKPDFIINFGIAGLLRKKYKLNSLILVDDFHLLNMKTKNIEKSIKNKFKSEYFKSESIITLDYPDETLKEEKLGKYGLLIDMEAFYYKKAAFLLPFYSIKFISDYNEELEKIDIKKLRDRLFECRGELLKIISKILDISSIL